MARPSTKTINEEHPWALCQFINPNTMKNKSDNLGYFFKTSTISFPQIALTSNPVKLINMLTRITSGFQSTIKTGQYRQTFCPNLNQQPTVLEAYSSHGQTFTLLVYR